MAEYIEYPLIKKNSIQRRLYQESVFYNTTKKNTLCVMPTGIGKTIIAVLLIAHRMNEKGGKAMMLAPTRPLVEQHRRTLANFLDIGEDDIKVFTGKIPPSQREKEYPESMIILGTPQTIRNDIIAGKIDLSKIKTLVFDEAHRAVGDYPYPFIAEMYMRKNEDGRILALTASPGSDRDEIDRICKNLFIDAVDIRTETDEDVKPYIRSIKFDWKMVNLPEEFSSIKILLEKTLKERNDKLKNWDFIDSINVRKRDLLELQGKLRKVLAVSNKPNPNIFKAISVTAEALKIEHGLMLLETQGTKALLEYLKRLQKQADSRKSRAVRRVMSDPKIKAAFNNTYFLVEKGLDHPKLDELYRIVDSELGKNPKSKIIVFSNYRDSVKQITQMLERIKNCRPVKFVGQAGETGLSQKEQVQILRDFEKGRHNTLVATSVHPDEYIILKNPSNGIEIQKIGDFVEDFLTKKHQKMNSVSKGIKDWSVLSTDGKKVKFFPVTKVHRHKRRSKVVAVELSSGFNTMITEDHSLFTFNKKKEHVPARPEKDIFANLAFSCPNIENEKKIDVVKELLKNAPREKIKNIFCSFKGLNQPKMRILSTNFKLLKSISKTQKFMKKMANTARVDVTTATDAVKRMKEKNYIKTYKKGRYKFCKLTPAGKEYLNFLTWFFKYHYYHKRKYRISLEHVENAPKGIRKFCELFVGVWYGKATVPRFLKLNKPLSEFLGLYVAEGSSKKTKYSSDVYLAGKNKKMQNKMKNSIIKGLKLRPSITRRGVATNAQIAHYLVKYVFKCGIGAHNKEVPNIIFSAPKKIKWKFLEAYCDGDGYIDYKGKRIVLTTVSKKLAVGLIFLLRQLGIKKITLKKDHCYRIRIFESLPFAKIGKNNGKKTYYDLMPKALLEEKYFDKYKNYYVSESRRKLECNDETHFDYIKNIKTVKKQPKYVYDISVRGGERFFGGLGLICLHNSVGEEGLDIPKVDMVIFYEPVPSEIRYIQRRGRTGRQAVGKLIVLMAKNTRDEAYFWKSKYREKKMKQILKNMKDGKPDKQKGLGEF